MKKIEWLETETPDNTIEKVLQIVKKQIEEIDVKLKNNDYDECNKINHDKMVLENRIMVLQNKMATLEIEKRLLNQESQNTAYFENNNLVIHYIIEIITQDNEISQDKKEKLLKLLKKLEPKK